jgi:aminomethyltransferase
MIDGTGEKLKRTPLFELHRAAGGRLVPFAGYEMPVQYAGILAECKAVREAAGIFDVSHMGQAHLRSAASFGKLSRSPAKAELGAALYTLIMRSDGGIIDDCIFYRHADSFWTVVLNASRKEIDLSVLEDAMTLPTRAMIALQGPEAVAMIGELCPRRRFVSDIEVLGARIAVACRTGYTGEDGYEFMLEAEEAPRLWKRLIDCGAAPCGLGARDLLRLEAGLPLYGHEMNETTNPWETGLGFAVDLDRDDDFAAREALTRLKESPRRRAGLKVVKGAVPRAECPVVDVAGREIGVVTSGAYSPLLDAGIALARIERSAVPAAVRIRGTDCLAEEVPLPFHRRRRSA